MDILLFRHGIAEDQGPDGTDESRRLTKTGIKRTRLAAKGLARFSPTPTLIFTSPKARAVQTAQIVADAFQSEWEVMETLANGPPAAIREQLLQYTAKRILLVGHEPTLSATAELLTSGGGQSVYDLKKAGCISVRITVNELNQWESGQVRWLATPGMLARMR